MTLGPSRNFHISIEERIAALHGPAAWIVRLRCIEDLEELYIAKIRGLRVKHESEHEVREHAERTIDLRSLNAMIEKHNRYYPIEANLPIDPATGVLMFGQTPWTPMAPITLEDLLLRAR